MDDGLPKTVAVIDGMGRLAGVGGGLSSAERRLTTGHEPGHAVAARRGTTSLVGFLRGERPNWEAMFSGNFAARTGNAVAGSLFSVDDLSVLHWSTDVALPWPAIPIWRHSYPTFPQRPIS